MDEKLCSLLRKLGEKVNVIKTTLSPLPIVLSLPTPQPTFGVIESCAMDCMYTPKIQILNF